ncbi:unnamed protein product [Parajaminaea phylloscopi]
MAHEDDEDTRQVSQPPLVLITSPWLDAVTQRIRARPIPWEGYARADLVSQEELKMIRSIESQSDDPDSILRQHGKEYALLYLRLLTKLSRTDTLQQVLVLVTDMLHNHDDRIKLFFDAAADVRDASKQQWPWAPLTKLLDVADDFVQLKAAHLLTLLLVAPTNSAATVSTTAPHNVLSRLLVFLRSLVNSRADPSPGAGALRQNKSPDDYADGNGADIAIQLLESLLRTQQFRSRVWQDDVAQQSRHSSEGDDGEPSQRAGIIRGLVYILQNALVAPQGSSPRGDSSPASSSSQSQSQSQSQPSTPSRGSSPVTAQMQYQVIFCFWLLSFDNDIAAELNRKLGVVPVLVDIARSAVKEKVVRITVAALRNLLAKAPEANAPVMLGSKLLPLVELLADRKWSDDEVVEDIEYLRGELSEKLQGMSTYDEYLSELSSGKLSWDNPAHQLDDFWKENGSKVLEKSSSGADGEADQSKAKSSDAGEEASDDGDEEIKDDGTGLGRLIYLLSTSRDATTLAVAAHDVGKLVQFTGETGRRKVNAYPGAKVQVMKLMSHDDADVKFRALNTVGKLVSASWRS